jgi:hypothetical protein
VVAADDAGSWTVLKKVLVTPPEVSVIRVSLGEGGLVTWIAEEVTDELELLEELDEVDDELTE